LNLILATLRLGLAIALLFYAWQWRSPQFAAVRTASLGALLILPAILIALEFMIWRFVPRLRTTTMIGAAVAIVAFVAFGLAAAPEVRFRWLRSQVLHAEPARLEKLGRHFIVGYRDIDELRQLIERRAIAGVFVTQHNVQGIDVAAIRHQIDGWQAIRRRQGLLPLLIATDHEGGIVSRMSPPLDRPTTLGEIVRSHHDEAERLIAVRQFAAKQGRALASLGINLNFAPVVDLDHGVVNPNDRFSRISERAISADPHVVEVVAGEYCAALLLASVRCTLKHFPGLGRVFEDTHTEHATLTASAATLARSDWVPFRALMNHAGTFTMLGHARLASIDRDRPASSSERVIGGLLRTEWRHDGVLVTDDFTMAAAYGADGGIADASVSALNAGIDLILISYDPDQFFPAMQALLRADQAGRLRPAMLVKSDARLSRQNP